MKRITSVFYSESSISSREKKYIYVTEYEEGA